MTNTFTSQEPYNYTALHRHTDTVKNEHKAATHNTVSCINHPRKLHLTRIHINKL